jgi:hypothetical protein
VQHPSGSLSAPRGLAVLANEGVEAGQVLVEPEHVRDRLRQRVARLRADVARNSLDPQVRTSRGEPYRARASRHGQRRLELSRVELGVIWRSSATPCEMIERAKSTGSPPAARSGSSATRVKASE